MPTHRTIQGYIYETDNLKLSEQQRKVRQKRFFMLKLDFVGAEKLFIQAGKQTDFMPCAARYEKGNFYLWAANCTGSDVRLSRNEFLKALSLLQSVELLKEWEERSKEQVNVLV